MPLERIKVNKSQNSFHSLILIASMTLLLILIGWALFEFWGAVSQQSNYWVVPPAGGEKLAGARGVHV